MANFKKSLKSKFSNGLNTLALASRAASASAAIARCNCWGSLTSFLHHDKLFSKGNDLCHKLKFLNP